MILDRILAFIHGVIEFRCSFTTHYESHSLALAYDRGRELAHRITRRRYE